MYILTVNTRKTTRSLSIFPHEKTSIQLLIFLRVFCSFPEEVNADNAVLIPRKNFTSPGYPNTEKACFGWIVRVFHNIPRDLRWRTDTVANALQWMQAFRRYIFISNWVKHYRNYRIKGNFVFAFHVTDNSAQISIILGSKEALPFTDTSLGFFADFVQVLRIA